MVYWSTLSKRELKRELESYKRKLEFVSSSATMKKDGLDKIYERVVSEIEFELSTR